MSREMGNMTPFDLDSWLERELRDRLGSPAGPSPLPAQSRYHAGYLKHAGSTSRTGRVKALASKQAAGALAAAVLVVGGGAIGAAAAATGSPDPQVWGAAVTRAVTDCKHALSTAGHGIGDCVSAVAKGKGRDVRSQHTGGQDHPGADPVPAATPQPEGPANRPGHPPTSAPAGRPAGRPEAVPTLRATGGP